MAGNGGARKEKKVHGKKGASPQQKNASSPQASEMHGASPGARKRPVLRFVALFIVLMAAFYGITSMAWYQDRVFQQYLNLNAEVSALLLRWFGEDARTSEQDVLSARMALSIRAGCDAIEPSAMFASALLAFPAAMKAKIIGLLVGVPLLLLLNLVRILSLYYIGIYAPNWFETAHVDIWQPLYILLALVCWILWVMWAMRRGPSGSSA